MVGHTDIVSHRGGALLWPENSLEAFRNSLALPVEQVECDVRLSADGVPVVIHDHTVQRTTLGQGAVSALTARELSQLRLRHAPHASVPTLAEVAALFSGKLTQLQVEIKGGPQDGSRPAALNRSLAVLDAAGIRGQSHIIAFDAGIAADAQVAGGLAGVIWLFERHLLEHVGVDGVIALALDHGFKMIETEIDVLDAPLCSRFRQAGLRLGAWGASRADALAKAFGLGLDAVATDDPVLALRLRA
ncbi:glycerophosphodiester phosphodiesterase [Roseomonas marmotae]|uniref:Glycerophosphodiester phosphodiesterase n=1 Tax=Roseomonas marmotae TaxID=2768161 RepID=A0ABS3KAK4_9PROT|nr:glycerophosphodiester phosphodiesterase family protein [Roseomonas marmotae]MBO1074483.1 glycerophosphodiester phosphodiesterase [Roseomonas marmotae]QTI78215.1 glycerophosphodiester phosphodiesterase [Roseomonas marmotae]